MNDDKHDDSAGNGTGPWHNRIVLWPLIIVALGLTATIQNLGVITAFIIAIAVALIARKQGSFRDLGFRAPGSWPKLLATTFAYGVIMQIAVLAIIEPLLAGVTGEKVDLSAFDEVRGNFVNFLILLAVGWIVGGFLEEFAFRGFVVGRVRWLLGSGTAATWSAVLIAAIPFGLAHAYQGVTGMISTGLTGFLLGAVYVVHRFNLWYAIFTHGFINTFGIVAIYLDIDRAMVGAVFP